MLWNLTAIVFALTVLVIARGELKRYRLRRRLANIERLEVALGMRQSRWAMAAGEASRKYTDGIKRVPREYAAREREDSQATSGMGA